MTTDDQAEPKAGSKPKAKTPKAKMSRKSKGMWGAGSDLPAADLVDEPRRPVTFKKLDMLAAAHGEWWAAAHGSDEKSYARTRDALYSLVVEYLPELISLARNTLKVRQN